MKTIKTVLIAVVVSVLGISIVSARHHTEPSAMRSWVPRDGIMHLLSDQRGILEDMAEGKTPADQAEFIRAANALVALFKMIPGEFKNNANPPMSRAKPEIWQNWDDFVAQAINNANIAADIVATAELMGVEAAKAKVESIDCGGCHDPYRAED